MALVFVRVELRGNPSFQNYINLHSLMAKNNWWQDKDGRALPHAVYWGNTDNHIGDVSKALRTTIQSNVWNSAIVMMIKASQWAMDPP
jgi:hypothetical protein